MPYVIRWPHKRAIAVAAACGALLCTAAPAMADAPCPMPSTSTVFAQFNDNANYSLVPGGSFSGSAPGWTLDNATLSSEAEPWNVSGSSTPGSLDIAPGGSAVSPTICVSSLFPSWRFFAKSADGASNSTLHVTAQWSIYNYHGVASVTNLSGSSFGSWEPTNSLILGSVIPPGYSVSVRFVFTADPSGSDWNIDDVYVDPYAK